MDYYNALLVFMIFQVTYNYILLKMQSEVRISKKK